MRRAVFLVVVLMAGGTPFVACTEDFSGGGGLPGDAPRRGADGTPVDSGTGPETASDAAAPDAPVKDVAPADVEEAGD